jgi:signal transduction histidine kinase
MAEAKSAQRKSKPVGAERRRERKDTRPQEIVAAAFEEFAAKGFAGTRLEDVAAQALVELKRRPVSQGRNLLGEGKGAATGDPVLLHQALVNLLENACQATPMGGRVLVRISERHLEVLDEGPGLSEDMARRMLRPFESGRPDGTGLGLPLALKWLNAQGADLRLSQRPEGGTRAEIRW